MKTNLEIGSKLFVDVLAVVLFTVVVFAGEGDWANAAENKTLAQQAAQFENRLCGVNPNRTLFRNAKREETVLFFQNYLPKDQTPLADFLAAFKTKEARKSQVKTFVDTNYSLMRKMDDVAATIGDRLIAKKLTWLGVERSSDEIDLERETELFKNAEAVEAQLKKDKVKMAEIKSYLMLQLGPILYSRWKNAQLRRVTKLVALDDMTIRMKSQVYLDSAEQKAAALLQAVPGSGVRTSEMEQIVDISQVSLFSGVKERPPEFLALVAKIKKPAVKALVEDYRKWIEQGVDAFGERDDATSKIILAQSGMGLVLLSANFGPGITDRLNLTCPNQLKKKTSP